MKLDDITKQSLLYDFYGALLTERQRQVLQLYHDENYSLAEIAAQFEISRQGVHDALKNGEKSLEEYERKLGLMEKFRRTREAVDEIDRRIDGLILKLGGEGETAEELKKIRDIIDNLED
ncbi:MAG: YlxM family DNA-binding protein [Clostridiales bacterium]|nr:YlxM family DNA-binding protein [Clostridiales bacterium]MDD7035438.1 YlxM family DNA-binding protein [Bacillota bacterium]MDY2919986.1 YlxM family DNA-binding protein [Lentihominibacter sp.]